MNKISGILSVLKKHKYLTFGALALTVVGFVYLGASEEPTTEEQTVLPVVTVSSPAKLSGTQEIAVVGTVRAFSEAAVTSETSGRVTSVRATLGEAVSAGTILATLENAAEQASVLQAEGAYEAALASADQSGVGLDEAQTNLQRTRSNAISTFQSSYNTVNDVIRNNVDDFYSNPNSNILGLKIDGQGNTPYFNNERVAYQSILQNWQAETVALNLDSDIPTALNEASQRIDRTIVLIDSFITLFNAEDRDRSYTPSELTAFSSNFSNLRTSLQSANNQIKNDLASLENARDQVRRAEIGATGSVRSTSEAQVKQALGSLRAAQARLAETIFRSPISGTVNSLNVRVGDFVGNQTVVARIANNNALEIVTFVSDNELNAFAVGSEVIVEDDTVGTVTAIAPAVDSATKKTEVRIATESTDIKNGDSVTIKKSFATEALEDQPIFIPLAAVKFEIDTGRIFVVENGVLQSKSVSTGIVRGGSVEITDGLAVDEEFVIDARGLLADTEVEVRYQ